MAQTKLHPFSRLRNRKGSYGKRMSYMEHYKFRTQPFSEHAGKDSLWRDGRMEGEGKGVRRGKRGQEPGEGKGVRSRIGVLGKLPWSAEIV